MEVAGEICGCDHALFVKHFCASAVGATPFVVVADGYGRGGVCELMAAPRSDTGTGGARCGALVTEQCPSRTSLIMAYMNVLEPKSWTQPAGDRDVRNGIGNAAVLEERHYRAA